MTADIFADIIPPKGAYPCAGCQCMLELPGICARCARREAQEQEAKRIRVWIRRLPRRHRDVTWAALPTLCRDDGSPRVPAERIAPARRLLEANRLVVIAGPPGEGKSTLAVAHLRAVAERHRDLRVRWMPAVSLIETAPVDILGESDAGPSAVDIALAADVLLLDDLGQELDSAPVGQGLLAQRKGPASRVVEHRFGNKLPTVITTGLTSHDIAELYGGGVHRRLTDGGVVIGRKYWESKDHPPVGDGGTTRRIK